MISISPSEMNISPGDAIWLKKNKLIQMKPEKFRQSGLGYPGFTNQMLSFIRSGHSMALQKIYPAGQ